MVKEVREVQHKFNTLPRDLVAYCYPVMRLPAHSFACSQVVPRKRVEIDNYLAMLAMLAALALLQYS